jgi:hypothetical protein
VPDEQRQQAVLPVAPPPVEEKPGFQTVPKKKSIGLTKVKKRSASVRSEATMPTVVRMATAEQASSSADIDDALDLVAGPEARR